MFEKSFVCLTGIVLGGVLVTSCTHEEKAKTNIADKVNHNHVGGYVAAAPVVDGGFAYAATGKGELLSLNVQTGEIEWFLNRGKDNFQGYCNITPAVAGDLVLAVDSTLTLMAVDKQTGDKKWVLALKPNLKNTGEEAEAKTDYAKVYWEDLDKDFSSSCCRGCFAADPTGKVMIIGGAKGKIYALDPQTGQLKWKQELYSSSELIARPVFTGNKVIFMTLTGRAWAFDLASGQNCWSLPKVMGVYASGKFFEKDGKSGVKLSAGIKYNFHGKDYFGEAKDDVVFKLSFLDSSGKKLSFKEGEKVIDVLEVKKVSAGSYQRAESQVQKKTVELSATPAQTTDFPVTVVLSTKDGKEIHRSGYKVTFKKLITKAKVE